MPAGLLYITHQSPARQAIEFNLDEVLRLVEEAFLNRPPLVLLYHNTNSGSNGNPPPPDTLVLVPIDDLNSFGPEWRKDREVKPKEKNLDVRLYQTLQVYEGFEEKDCEQATRCQN